MRTLTVITAAAALLAGGRAILAQQHEPATTAPVTMAYYESGHMMYIHRPSLIRLRADLRRFYDDASGPAR